MFPARRTSRFAVSPVPASAPDLSAPIDRAHLARYTLGDSGLEREILCLFLEHLPNTIRDLGAAATVGDWHRAAHTLKGSARAVGAWRLASTAEAAEKIVDIANPAISEAALGRISEAAAETNAYIAKMMASA